MVYLGNLFLWPPFQLDSIYLKVEHNDMMSHY